MSDPCDHSFLNQRNKHALYHDPQSGDFKVDGGVTFDFVVCPVSSEPRLLPNEDRVNLRAVSCKYGYKVMIELRDQSKRG